MLTPDLVLFLPVICCSDAAPQLHFFISLFSSADSLIALWRWRRNFAEHNIYVDIKFGCLSTKPSLTYCLVIKDPLTTHQWHNKQEEDVDKQCLLNTSQTFSKITAKFQEHLWLLDSCDLTHIGSLPAHSVACTMTLQTIEDNLIN